MNICRGGRKTQKPKHIYRSGVRPLPTAVDRRHLYLAWSYRNSTPGFSKLRWRVEDHPLASVVHEYQITHELVERMLADLQAVLFDLDGTLLDRRRSFEHFIRDQWKRFFSSTQTVDLEPYVETLIELDRDGYTPRKELFTGMAA